MKNSDIAEKLRKEFDIKEWVTWVKSSPQRHVQLIGNYAEEINADVRNYEQGELFLRRHTKAARDLSVFTDDQIANAMKRVYQEEYITKWTLDTLLKYIF